MKITGSPDTKNGYTTIANELLEAILIYPFNTTELKLVLAIIRETYGWKQKAKPLSYNSLVKLTRIDKRYIRRSINKLIQNNVVIKRKTMNKNVLGLNKHYLTWKLWITQGAEGQETPMVGDSRPSGRGQETPKNEGHQTPPINKERNIYKRNIKERENFYPQPFFKNQNQNIRIYPKEPIHIEKVIKSIT